MLVVLAVVGIIFVVGFCFALSGEEPNRATGKPAHAGNDLAAQSEAKYQEKQNALRKKYDPYTGQEITPKMEATYEEWERMALEQLPEAIAEQPIFFAKFQKAHEADIADYTFDCKRHGDFLTLFISRRVYRGWIEPQELIEKESESINLSKCRQIKLIEGSMPDLAGVNEFEGSESSKWGKQEENGEITWHGGEITVTRPTDYLAHRLLFALDSVGESGNNFGGIHRAYKAKTKIPNAARRAVDDQIVFAGVGTLYAPAGIGKQVQGKILAELEKVTNKFAE